MSESPGKMYALATVLSVLAIVAVALRFRVRTTQKQGLGVDDWLMIPALICTIGTAATIYAATANGGLGGHTKIDPQGQPELDAGIVIYYKAMFVSLLTQVATFGFTKLAVLKFYQRLFRGKIFAIASWAMITIVIIWFIGHFFVSLFQCTPITANWLGGGASAVCIDPIPLYKSMCWSDVLTDALILSLPIPIIWKLQLQTRRKVTLSFIFLLGILVLLAGVARIVAYYHVENELLAGDPDLTYLLAPTFYWPMVESSLGIVGACLPTLRPLFTGTSPESVILPIRSAISLGSLGGNSINQTRARSAFQGLSRKYEDKGYQNSSAAGVALVESRLGKKAEDQYTPKSYLSTNALNGQRGIMVETEFGVEQMV